MGGGVGLKKAKKTIHKMCPGKNTRCNRITLQKETRNKEPQTTTHTRAQ